MVQENFDRPGPQVTHGVSHGVPDGPRPEQRGRPAAAFAYLIRQVPTLLVLAALGGLAWWGHHTGWKIPKFSQLAHGAAEQEKEDWCMEHNVPDSTCLACHPELAGANPADWCKEHGVPESKCTVCHPEILTKGVAGDWCKEHGVPESGCTACHPELAVKTTVADAANGAKVLPSSGERMRPEAGAAARVNHEKPDMATAQAPTTRPGKDPKTCQTHARKVQFASTESVRKAGLQFAVVSEQAITASLAVNAETDYDRTRVAQVSSPVAGRVWRIEKQVGQAVKEGEVIALIDSADVGRAKAELLGALATLDLRTKTLRRINASAEKGFRGAAEQQEAEAAVREANIKVFNAQQALLNLGLSVRKEDLATLGPERIQFLGLSDAVVKSLDPAKATANLLPLVAPLDGVVIEHADKTVVAGEMTDAGKALMMIADTGRLWVTMDVAQTDAPRVAIGQEVVFRPDAQRDQPLGGRVAWISTAVDDQTRTLRVRAEVDNAGGRLSARTWGRGQIVVRQTPNAIAIPNESVQWEGCCYVAFVRLSDTVFQTRKLRIGTRTNALTEVVIGVLPGETVVTTGSNVLKSEILKANLGAGCTDD